MNTSDALGRLQDLRECFIKYETIVVKRGDLAALNFAIEIIKEYSLKSFNQKNTHVVKVKLDVEEFIQGLNDLRLAIDKLKLTTINVQFNLTEFQENMEKAHRALLLK